MTTARDEIKRITTRSEKSKELYDRVERYEATYEGGEEYRELDGVMRRHERESSESFRTRREAATYANFAAPVVDLYANYLHREPPSRDVSMLSGAAFDAFWADCDLEGRTYDQVIRRISKEGGIKGVVGVIVDKPASTGAASRQEELDAGIRPYVAIYEPEDILGWDYVRVMGRPTLVRLSLAEEGGNVRVWFPDRIEEYTKTAGSKTFEMAAGFPIPNPVGIIPFVLHRNRDNFERFSGRSDLADIADLCQRIFQIDSSAAEVIENTGFPFLEEPEKTPTHQVAADGSPLGAGGDLVIGTGSVVTRPQGDTVGHRYVEPAHASLSRMLEWRNSAIGDLQMIAKTLAKAQQTQRAQSGVALEIEFQELNAVLAEKAEGIEKTELAILRLFSTWEGLDSTGVSVVYPRRFGVRDLSADLDAAIKSKILVTSQAYAQELAKETVRRMLPNAEDSVIAAIDAELEKTSSAAQSTLDLLNGGGGGNQG